MTTYAYRAFLDRTRFSNNWILEFVHSYYLESHNLECDGANPPNPNIAVTQDSHIGVFYPRARKLREPGKTTRFYNYFTGWKTVLQQYCYIFTSVSLIVSTLLSRSYFPTLACLFMVVARRLSHSWPPLCDTLFKTTPLAICQ